MDDLKPNGRRIRKPFARSLASNYQQSDASNFGTDGMETRKMTVNITPLHDVYSCAVWNKQKPPRRIIIPIRRKKSPGRRIIAVGAGKLEKGPSIPLDVKAGDGFSSANIPAAKSRIDGQILDFSARRKFWSSSRNCKSCLRQEVTAPTKKSGRSGIFDHQEGEVSWQTNCNW